MKLVFRLTDGKDTQVERMWVIVKTRTEKGYTGVLDNDPYCTERIKSGIALEFEARHVIQIDTVEKK